MILHNKFLINLINTSLFSNIIEGEEFNSKEIFTNTWDNFCIISYEDYLDCQNDPSFLTDIAELDKVNAQVGIIIRNVTELTVEKAVELQGKGRIYILDPTEEKMTSNSYFYLDEYIKARKKLDQLMKQVDLSEPDELKRAQQIYVLLRKQYKHEFPLEENDVCTAIRYSQNMYGCLCLQKGVCAGGGQTFRAMCSLANIKCRTICIDLLFSDNYKLGHVFNQICVNEEWGIVDVEQNKNIPEDTSLFFCSENTYKTYWEKNQSATYTISKHSSSLMPTNISISRKIIDSLDNERCSTLKNTTTNVELLRTLAVTEVLSGTTMDDLEKVNFDSYISQEKEEFQNEPIL